MEWWQRQQATAEAARRRALMETYTTPLPKNNESDKLALRTFLSNFYKTFYSQSSRMESKAILEEYNEVKVYHDKLVVANQTKDIRAHKSSCDNMYVSPEDFWQRYYFRCTVDEIILEYNRTPIKSVRSVINEGMQNLDSVRKSVLSKEEEEDGKHAHNNDISSSNSGTNTDSSVVAGGMISSFLDTCRKIDETRSKEAEAERKQAEEANAIRTAKQKEAAAIAEEKKKEADEKRRIAAEEKKAAAEARRIAQLQAKNIADQKRRIAAEEAAAKSVAEVKAKKEAVEAEAAKNERLKRKERV